LLTGEVSENGIGASNIEIDATNRYSTTVENATITLPSRFSANDWNNDILADRSDVTVTNNGTNQVDLDFTGGDYTVSCAVAGLNSEPEFSPPVQNTPEEPSQELSAPTIESAELGRLNNLGTYFFFGDRSVQDVSQYNLSYTVTAEDDNLEYVALQLKDSNGVVVTATTQAVPSDSTNQYSGQWHTPWFDDEYLNDSFAGNPEDYSVSIEAFGTNSPTDNRSVTVGENLMPEPAFSSNPTISDDSTGGDVSYEVQYDVDDPNNDFDRVRVTFDCTSCSGNSGDKTKEDQSTSGTISYSRNNKAGDSYEITVEVLDTSDTVTDRYTVDDTSDGVNP
jgi:hypothetical protein